MSPYRRLPCAKPKRKQGLDVEITGLAGIYTNPNHRIEYTSDGEVRQEFAVVFTARPTAGNLSTSEESTQVGWFQLSELDGLAMHRTMRMRIDHFAQLGDSPHLG